MGGNNKSVTVGYRYSLGAHLALCHGPIDAVREILVDGRTAWSAATGGGGFSGGGGATQVRIGSIGAVSAVPALAGDLGASVSFASTLSGMRIGRDYRLALGSGASHDFTLLSVSYDRATNTTRWTVTPATLAFTATSASVFSSVSPASNSGAGGGRIRIDKPDLFGGEGREGGIVGDIDVLMGAGLRRCRMITSRPVWAALSPPIGASAVLSCGRSIWASTPTSSHGPFAQRGF